MIKKIFITLLCISVITSDFSFGSCPNVQFELDSLDIDRYLGTWYEVARSKSIPFEKGNCVRATYSKSADGKGIDVLNQGTLDDGSPNDIKGKAFFTKNPLKFKLQFADSFIAKFFKGDYEIVNTDYDNFALIYACTDLYVCKNEWFWVLSRDPRISQEKLDEFLAYYRNKFGVQPDTFMSAKHDKEICGY